MCKYRFHHLAIKETQCWCKYNFFKYRYWQSYKWLKEEMVSNANNELWSSYHLDFSSLFDWCSYLQNLLKWSQFKNA